MSGSVSSSLCECESESEEEDYEPTSGPLSVRPSNVQTQDAGTCGTDPMTDTVSSRLSRIGPVRVIRGGGDQLSYDPYGECRTVLLIVAPNAGDDEMIETEINSALCSCPLPYVRRFDVDISGIKRGHEFHISSFIEMYNSTLREVRVVCSSVLPDLETVMAGYGQILDSVHHLSHLERLTLVLKAAMLPSVDVWTTFFTSDLPYLTNLVHLRIQATCFGPRDIVVSAPALKTLVLEETLSDTGVISLAALSGLTKLCISSARHLYLSDNSPQLQFIDLHRVTRLVGDLKNVQFANIAYCPAELVAHLMIWTMSRHHNSLRHLGLRFIHAPRLFINATYLDVLFLSKVTIDNIDVKRRHKLNALYVHDVLLKTASSTSMGVKQLFLSGSCQSICSFISNTNVEAAYLKSLAIDLACEGDPSISDLSTLFACFLYSHLPKKMPNLQYMASSNAASSRELPGMLGRKQLEEFACHKLAWPAVKSNLAILTVSKTQTTCEDVSQFWYEKLGFESPLVHGANSSWSFLLSANVRKIIQDDEAFVERAAVD